VATQKIDCIAWGEILGMRNSFWFRMNSQKIYNKIFKLMKIFWKKITLCRQGKYVLMTMIAIIVVVE
jgi:hypothetical protein